MSPARQSRLTERPAVEGLRADRNGTRAVTGRRTLAWALVLLAGAWAAPAAAQQSFDVALRDGLLSIRANGTPADELAQALGEATGIAVVVTGEGSTPLSVEIVDEPVAKAIALLAPNHMLVRASAAADADITEVVLMMPDEGDIAGGDSTEFLPSGNPADDVAMDQSLVETDENGLPILPGALRDPNRMDQTRSAADGTLLDPATGEAMTVEDAAAASVGGFQQQDQQQDIPLEPLIDPATGEPLPAQ